MPADGETNLANAIMQFMEMQQTQARQQQEHMMKTQQEFLRQLTETFKAPTTTVPRDDVEFRMESLASSISEFRYDPEADLTFDAWHKRYESLFAEDAKRLDDAARVRLLLRKLETRCHQQYVDIILPKEPKEFTFEETVVKLGEMFGKKKSLFNTRYQCMQLSKSNFDDMVSYAANVNKQCEDFKIGTITADQFKCLIFVGGLRSPRDADIRTKLLSLIDAQPDVYTVEKLTKECQRLYNLKQDTAMLEKPPTTANVNAVIHRSHKPHNKSSKDVRSSQQSTTPTTPCWFCGQLHFSRFCQFKTHICQQCKSMGHKEGYCGVNRKKFSHSKPKIKTIAVVNHVEATKRKFVEVQLNKAPVNLQLDTGSDITVISRETWFNIGQPPGRTPEQRAKSASGGDLKLELEFSCEVTIGNTSRVLRCYVTPRLDLNVLGLDWICAFDLGDQPINKFCNQITKLTSTDQILKQFATVFSPEMGFCTKAEASLILKPNSKPIFRPRRPVAYAVLPQLEDELQRLENLKIIERVDYSEWAAPVVVVKKKNGDIRVCADFSTGLNDALELHRHPIPDPEGIYAGIAGCAIFSQIDLSDAYLQVGVQQESRKFLTISTHRGLYQFARLPAGVKSAPGIFQQIMDAMIAGVPKTFAYMDDIIVGGRDEQEHDASLSKLLERIQEYGFRLKMDKCRFAMPEIKYLGNVIDKNGLRPDPNKIQAIIDLPPPHDLATLRSFLGAINYYGKYIPQIRDLRRPLDDLLKKDAPWSWTGQCQRSVEQFRAILRSDLALTHYDPKLEIILAADASRSGIGSCLLHRFPDGRVKAIGHVSRTLTAAEQNYSQIEKEALSIIFGVTRFHRMIYGRSWTLQTDHKPLLAIFGSKKGIPVYTANRLQRWALALLAYDFQIEYISTDKFGHADVLSRLIKDYPRPEEDCVIASIQLEQDVEEVARSAVSLTPITFKMVQEETKKERQLQEVIKYLQEGWPAEISEEHLKIFHRRRESLSVVRGSLMFMERVVMPTKFHGRILEELHKGHQGIERMKALARSSVYWPNIDKAIETFVKSCRKCMEAAKTPIKVPLEPWPMPDRVWQRIHIDYAGPINDEYYLVVVDAYSKWLEIFPTRVITSQQTINVLRRSFATFGLPETIVSDNATQFTAERFKDFCTANGIVHLRTPPYHPQSNGQAERFVDTFKRAMKKIDAGETIGEFLNTFLASYRSTPSSSAPGGKSPAELMFGRPIRTVLDIVKPVVKPMEKTSEDEDIKNKQADQFNRRHGVKQKSFVPHDLVYVKLFAGNGFRWVPGRVVERLGVVYNVLREDSSGDRLVRAHANQLRSRHDDVAPHVREVPLQLLLDAFGVAGPESRAHQPQAPHAQVVEPESLPEEVVRVAEPGAFPGRVVSMTSREKIDTSTLPTPQPPVVRRSGRERRPPQHLEAYRPK